MFALTIPQPWAWAIVHSDRRIENRDWRPPRYLLGNLIAIHAGKTLDRTALEHLRTELGLTVPERLLVSGAVVAVAKVRGSSAKAPASGHPQTRWWEGPIAWIFDQVVMLPTPVPSRGYPKVWRLPAAVESNVCEQWGKARQSVA